LSRPVEESLNAKHNSTGYTNIAMLLF